MAGLGQFQSILQQDTDPASSFIEAIRRARRQAEQESGIQRSLLRQQLTPGLRDIAAEQAARGAFFSGATEREAGQFAGGIAQQEAGIERGLSQRLAELARARAQALGVPILGGFS